MRSAQLLTILLIALISSSVASGQSAQKRGDSKLRDNPLFTSDLVVWTEMQAPSPVQGASPNPQNQTSSDQAKSGDNQRANPKIQRFAGTIIQEGNAYILRTSDKWSYDLDDQATAAQYLNQRVAITGTLNASGDLIHIHEIQPVS
jgi:hypothetical protein